ncbi:hypothetical protein PLICRDRAFT_353986 [Plicaturopsis crispa FD-325 SS-3]|uniref:Uncharacterized protein n=1 Tax=Plicaturopsis crispa FD-325 SS-3 TaxID=944288 RepID=A0A0C9SXT4_PLICR|nr:hypothetical protein PLICRDRAFT_353986 [Plicaturopsis crispa FD-325 SS-3]
MHPLPLPQDASPKFVAAMPDWLASTLPSPRNSPQQLQGSEVNAELQQQQMHEPQPISSHRQQEQQGLRSINTSAPTISTRRPDSARPTPKRPRSPQPDIKRPPPPRRDAYDFDADADAEWSTLPVHPRKVKKSSTFKLPIGGLGRGRNNADAPQKTTGAILTEPLQPKRRVVTYLPPPRPPSSPPSSDLALSSSDLTSSSVIEYASTLSNPTIPHVANEFSSPFGSRQHELTKVEVDGDGIAQRYARTRALLSEVRRRQL